MDEKQITCSFCGKTTLLSYHNKCKHPDGWLTIALKEYGYTDIHACEQCARFLIINRLLVHLNKPYNTRAYGAQLCLDKYFPDVQKLEDTDK